MALKDKWVDKVDGVDIASADDINQVASAVIELENQVESGGGKGEDGFSPVVSAEKIEGGNRVVITDAKGDNTFDVMDGADGKDYVLTEADKQEIAEMAAELVPSGGGGSGGGVSFTTLWSGEADQGATITLIDDFEHYDYLIATAGISGDRSYQFTGVFRVADLKMDGKSEEKQMYLSTPFEATNGTISNYCGMVIIYRKNTKMISIMSKFSGWKSAKLFSFVGVKITV